MNVEQFIFDKPRQIRQLTKAEIWETKSILELCKKDNSLDSFHYFCKINNIDYVDAMLNL